MLPPISVLMGGKVPMLMQNVVSIEIIYHIILKKRKKLNSRVYSYSLNLVVKALNFISPNRIFMLQCFNVAIANIASSGLWQNH